jgi:hypothetical protein
MRRLLTASALFTLVLFATAAGQPGQPPKAADDKKADKKVEKKPDPTDAAIAAALANDPDVRMAKAKIQLAEAELAKARQVVTLKIVALKGKIDQLKVEVRTAEDRVAWSARMVEKGLIQQSQLLADRDKLEAAKANLATAESEWKLLTGVIVGSGDPAADKVLQVWPVTDLVDTPDAAARLRAYQTLMLQARNALKGPIPDRLRAALDKPVKLGAKGEKITFEKALEVFKKEAGLDVPVRGRYPTWPRVKSKTTNELQTLPIELTLEGEELPVGAWFQLFEDNAVLAQPSTPVRFYVREYGLLISYADTAPPDAPSLTEFWKQKPPAKEVKEPKVDPAPKR